MRVCAIAIFLFMATGFTSCFSAGKPQTNLNIKNVTLKDTVLVKEIESFILTSRSKDSVFSNMGYVQSILDRKNYNGRSTVYSCYFNQSYYAYDNAETRQYPLFYTYIANTLVTLDCSFFTNSLNYQLNPRSIKRFKSRLVRFVPKAENVKARDQNGLLRKFKNVRMNIVVLHGGKTFYKFEDGSYLVEDAKH